MVIQILTGGGGGGGAHGGEDKFEIDIVSR